ncbi:serpin family protein [Lipingzhangella sp. LS1_29]|uniref:Serpin family protein n=1 Tax=Lipingzhangella rawalii TaxID=2055835 RepID=A0ABU2H0J8_9ACTN|nr:serpin family protein [Lipingzhangella rawalii]MDS1268831.1 serpin family protein [Lipingzhangella rawalii]
MARPAPPSFPGDHVDFALRLGGTLEPPASGNRIFSPYSLATALSLVASGARGTTREELDNLLGPEPATLLTELNRAAGAAPDDADRGKDAPPVPDLASRTALWTRPDIAVEPRFESTLRQCPDAAVLHADFATDADRARQEINSDVSKVTRGRITDLLGPGSLHADTRAVLVNALWARLRWLTPFDADATRPTTFHAPDGRRSVPMMRHTGQLPHAELGGWRMVTLRAEHELAMDVVLPSTPPAERHVPSLPAPAELHALYRARSPTEVRLQLPRFGLSYDSELSGALSQCGVRTVFTSDADLTGISRTPLMIDGIQHKAVLEVDEYGAEGAAATAVMMTLAAVSTQRPVTFTADRPFHVLLRRDGALLFLGTVAAP